jgi:hypothetical protein
MLASLWPNDEYEYEHEHNEPSGNQADAMSARHDRCRARHDAGEPIRIDARYSVELDRTEYQSNDGRHSDNVE